MTDETNVENPYFQETFHILENKEKTQVYHSNEDENKKDESKYDPKNQNPLFKETFHRLDYKDGEQEPERLYNVRFRESPKKDSDITEGKKIHLSKITFF